MAEKKKGRKRKEEYIPPGEQSLDDKPTKEEFAIAKWMRNNVPIKKTKFLNHNVEYFTGLRAIDALLESKWAQGPEPRFRTRDDIVDCLHTMLVHKFYHRARKVPVSEAELKGKRKERSSTKVPPASAEIIDDGNKDKGTDAESSVVEGKSDQQQPEKEKRKKKIRLDMHNDQRFVDGLDAYVWIYDPIPFHYWIIGTLLVLGAIGVCLFPLWPPSVRLGVYYLSLAAAGFLVTVILLVVIRLIVFCLIWLFTLGKHHLWILPNLTEDVGFFASFWPLYTYEYRGGGYVPTTKTVGKDKKKKKNKDSDAEEDSVELDVGVVKSLDGKTIETLDSDLLVGGISHKNVDEDDDEEEQRIVQGGGTSESESESSQRSSTGKDFEILDQDELVDTT